MKVVVCKDYAEMSAVAARQIAAQITLKPDCVLGLATGSTPEGTYAELIRKYQEGKVSFAQVRSVNLDEYYPIRPENDQSYRYFMNTKLFDHVDIDKANTRVPDGTAADPKAAGEAYDAMIDALGGIDMQLLGIGQNGHIGFNEPAQELEPGTHLTDLTPQTIAVNSRFFASEKDVPRQAMTMGVASIMKARRILILASGVEKHAAVKGMLSGKITTLCPATLLALHPNVTLICDRAAYEG